jgi:hypothetical protein
MMNAEAYEDDYIIHNGEAIGDRLEMEELVIDGLGGISGGQEQRR